METYAGILTIIVVVAAIWYGVRARNRWHAENDKPQQGSGGSAGPRHDTDRH